MHQFTLAGIPAVSLHPKVFSSFFSLFTVHLRWERCYAAKERLTLESGKGISPSVDDPAVRLVLGLGPLKNGCPFNI